MQIKFTIIFLIFISVSFSAFGAEIPPLGNISWGINKIYSSVANAPGNYGSYWKSSCNIVNPLNYDILIQFKDYTNSKSLLDLVVSSGEQIRIKDLVSYLGLPEGIYAINIFVRAASIEDVLLIGVNVFTYTLQEDNSIKGCSLPEKKYFGKTTYVIPFDFNSNTRKMLYIVAINNVKYDIFWFNDLGLFRSDINLDKQGIVRYIPPEGTTYVIVKNKVAYEVSGFSNEPEIYCYSTSTDNITNDTQILTNN